MLEFSHVMPTVDSACFCLPNPNSFSLANFINTNVIRNRMATGLERNHTENVAETNNCNLLQYTLLQSLCTSIYLIKISLLRFIENTRPKF